MTSLSDRWRNWRNRTIADPVFQRWAARFPLTRPIARARTRQAFDLVAGFVYSQILAACLSLRIFETLAKGPHSVETIAAVAQLSPAAAERLLKAAVSLKLLEHAGAGRYALASLGAVIAANPAIVAMVEHHALLYADLADPVSLLRGQGELRRLPAFWTYADGGAATGENVAAYSQLMATSQRLVATQILDAYPLKRNRRLLDVGGGQGAFAIEAAVRNPHLSLTVFDLPPVAVRATKQFEGAGIASRASAIGGDFFTDALPRDADIVTLIRVLHDHSDANVTALLGRIREAIPAGGTVLIAEPMASTPGAEPIGDAYFGFYLLAMGSGRPRTSAEYVRMLRQAGFGRVRAAATATPALAQIVVATA